MSINTALEEVGAVAIAAAVGMLSVHSGDPGAAGTSNTTTAAKEAATFAASNGVISLSSSVAFTGGAASGPATHYGLWDATGVTFYGSGKFGASDDQAFNAAGGRTDDRSIYVEVAQQ